MKRWWFGRSILNARLALPPRWALVAVGLVYILLEALQLVGRAIDAGQFGPAIQGRGPLWYLGLLVEPSYFPSLQAKMLCLAALAFGVHRVAAFHPFFRDAYRNWLKTTCWHVGKPLPLGPVTLTFVDAFLLALATGLLWHANTAVPPFAGVPLFAVVALFAAAYLMVVAISLFCFGPRGGGYAVVLGLLGMSVFARQLELACLIAVPTYVVAHLSLRRSLARLPHYDPGWVAKNFGPKRVPQAQQSQSQPSIAWPFAYLSPQPPAQELPRFDAICLAALAGCAFFSLTTALNPFVDSFLFPDREAPKLIIVGWVVCGIAAVARLFAYCVRYRPPISLLGRLATGRWCIPSYDRGLVAPVGSLLILWCLEPGFLLAFHVPTVVEMSLTLTLALLVALVPGPSYRSWVLTSQCRIVPWRLQ
ncbi:MAG TPA: hypothetical protein VMR25_26835 [Planctomycetaceae bacterium]|jgi:hypothetical protein|nr:hypothetical protein [Planctomycetaceae bacterium]